MYTKKGVALFCLHGRGEPRGRSCVVLGICIAGVVKEVLV